MSVTVRLDSSGARARAEAAARRATQVVMGELSAAFQQSFTAVAWNWPRQTVRSNGSIVGSPRNTIDTALLRQSHRWQMTGPYQATFYWGGGSVQYASAVFNGAVLRNGTRLPARPLQRAVMGQENVDGVVVYNLDDRLRNVWMGYLRGR
jgi:hypothetical protein